MSAINEKLALIKNATYGKDVRQAIIDSITQCYADATGNPESLSALVNQVNQIQDTTDTIVVSGGAVGDKIGLLILDASSVEKDTLAWIQNQNMGNIICVETGGTHTVTSGNINYLDETLGFVVSGESVKWYQGASEVTEETALNYISANDLMVYVIV